MTETDLLYEQYRNDEQVAAFRRNRESFVDDPYRPRYHFVPPGENYLPRCQEGANEAS